MILILLLIANIGYGLTNGPDSGTVACAVALGVFLGMGVNDYVRSGADRTAE